MVETVKYAQAFSFKYSTRPGTPGADLTDQVAEEVKAERLERLQALLLRQQKEFAESLVGKTMDVLLEKPGRMHEQLIGRSPWLQSVNLDAKTLKIGDIVNVRITATGPNSLFAEVAGS
jgi:tRNA-2-methylthio-N6-dimethylallyladenosine synthase